MIFVGIVLLVTFLGIVLLMTFLPTPFPFRAQPRFTTKEKLNILDRVAWSEMFETFLANKYSSTKRFGLEGAETLIPGMKTLIDRAADMGVEAVVIGMPHRGGWSRLLVGGSAIS